MANLTTIARPYAKAILGLIKDDKHYAQWTEMLQFLTTVIQDPQMNALVRNLAIPSKTKAEVICNLAPEMLTSEAKNLVKLLAHAKRLLIIPALFTLYEKMRRRAQKQILLELSLATPVDDSYLNDLQQDFSRDFAATALMETDINPELIGGGKIKIGDQVVDASINSRLLAMHQELTH